MLISILIFYYIFSVLFMIGYVDVNTKDETIYIYTKMYIYFLVLITAPIMFPFNIGYYIYKNS